ncbi:MAG TPA: hypothetical protein VMF65_20685 [Acidimicrobiales bacterium]|nr:hypothetical protein [Acidimicrobiales bacterium]
MPGIAPVLMKAWADGGPGPVDGHLLVEVGRPAPGPRSGPGRPRVRAAAAPVCNNATPPEPVDAALAFSLAFADLAGCRGQGGSAPPAES